MVGWSGSLVDRLNEFWSEDVSGLLVGQTICEPKPEVARVDRDAANWAMTRAESGRRGETLFAIDF